MNRRVSIGLAITIVLMPLAGCAFDLSLAPEAFSGDIPGSGHPALENRPILPGGVIQNPKPIPAGLGVNIHFYEGNEKDWKMLAEAGVGIVRMDVGWGNCEKKPGEYDFSRYDALVSRLAEHNIRLLFIIDYGNPLYDKGLAPHSDECRAAYARFCHALVKRYAGKGIIWELWNEPNIGFWKPKPNVDDYMAWCKAVVPAIRRADPTACVIAPATSCIPVAFLEECFRRGLLELVDGVSVHPYRGGKSGPETAIREYKRLDRLIRRYTPRAEKDGQRKRIPILSGEWGYSTTYISREQQGKYLPRQWLANTVSGLPISIWYDWHDDGKDPKEKEHNFGTVTWDYKPKPAYVAMKTLIEQLRGYVVVDRIEVGDEDDFVVVARKDDQVKLAIWTTGEPHEVELGTGIGIAGAVDHLGKRIEVADGSRQRVTDAPRYLTVAAPVPGWLKMMPMSFDVYPWPTSGLRDMLVLITSLANPTSRSARVKFHPILGQGVEGSWGRYATRSVEPGQGEFFMWFGDAHRRDVGHQRFNVCVDISVEGEAAHTVSKVIEVGVPDPVSMKASWRQDGLVVLLTAGGRGFCGRLVLKVDGVTRRPIEVCIDPPERTCEIRVPEVKLRGVACNVGVRLLDMAGHLAAELEPMTYELVDAIEAPVGTDVGEGYRLWHEGAKDRKARLTGKIVESPGQDPPFAKAVRVDYDMAAGWCFWQLGPKRAEEMVPVGVRPKRIMFWVHGEGSGDTVRCRLVDKTGQTFQPQAGTMNASGWRLMEMSLEGHMGHWGGAGDGVVHPPLRWTSYYLQDSTKTAHRGTTHLTGVVVAW